MKTKKLGFTLLELMIALAIVSIIYETIATQYFNQQKTEMNRANAVLHQAFAQQYSDYIQDNYASIWSIIGTGTRAVIPYSTLVASGYASSLYNINNFKPCAIILADQNSKTLFPLIVDVASSTTPNSKINSRSGSFYLGDYAGYYSGTIFTGNAGWSIDTTTSPYFTGSNPLSACDFPDLVQNSIATNLVLSPFFLQHKSDIALSRYLDTSVVGPQNLNVDKADMVLGYPANPISGNTYNRIFFSAESTLSSKPYCASGKSQAVNSTYYNESNVVCPNSDIATGGFLSKQASTLTGASCTLIGKIISETGNRNSSGKLICTYSPSMCSLLANAPRSSCYLSDTTQTIRYYPNASTFTCPNPTPIAIDAGTNTQNLSFVICNSENGCGTNADFHMGIQYNNNNAITTTALLTPQSVTTTVGNASVYTGASSTAMPLITSTYNDANCSNICTKIYQYTGGVKMTSANECVCSGGGVPTMYVTNISITGSNLNLNYVTCSNKNSVGP